MITVGILVTVAAFIVPQMASADRARLMSASAMLRSDLELAQTMSISSPSNPIAVRFEPAQNRYWLAYAATPGMPMDRPGTMDPYLVEFGVGEASSAANVALTISGPADNTVTFNSLGGLSALAGSPAVRLSFGSQAIELTISHLTGSISEQDLVMDTDGEFVLPAAMESN